ncbi:phosphopantothenoylcysteine decarboxylase [Candidatus Latescibacterota bacterium]
MASKRTQRVLVTSGPTRAYLDRVRYLANSSSGALGAAVVQALTNRGLPVMHLTGVETVSPEVNPPELLETVPVATVDNLIREIRQIAENKRISAVVHAMAVLDYVPETTMSGKKKSDDDVWTVRLVKTPKVIGMLRGLFGEAFLVGFKLEAGASDRELVDRAGALLETNALDLVVANDIDRVTGTRHAALIVGPAREVLARPVTKRDIGETLAGIIAGRLG